MVVLYMAREEKLTHAPEQHASKAGILRAQDFGPAFSILRVLRVLRVFGFYSGKTSEQQTSHQIGHITARVTTI